MSRLASLDRIGLIRSRNPLWFVLLAAGAVIVFLTRRLPPLPMYIGVNAGLLVFSAGLAGLTRTSASGFFASSGLMLGLLVFFIFPNTVLSQLTFILRAGAVLLFAVWLYAFILPVLHVIVLLYNLLAPLLPAGGISVLVDEAGAPEPEPEEESPEEETEAESESEPGSEQSGQP